MSDWNPETRDAELHHISNLSKGIAVVAVGGTVLLGAGIAWGDQQRVTQANNREATQQQPADSTTISPPANTPTTSPTQQPSTSKSKSGGS